MSHPSSSARLLVTLECSLEKDLTFGDTADKMTGAVSDVHRYWLVLLIFTFSLGNNSPRLCSCIYFLTF